MMPNDDQDKLTSLPRARKINILCLEFEKAWMAKGAPRIEDYLIGLDEAEYCTALVELVAQEVDLRRSTGESVEPHEYKDRFPQRHTEVETAFDLLRQGRHSSSDRAVDHKPRDLPEQIGRYRVVKLLGTGGFGRVYLAEDDRLQRPVAVKVPHPHLVFQPEDVETYLTEARTVASLDHPNIVPVYDTGESDMFRCFVVSKYVEGGSLDKQLKQARLSVAQSRKLVAVLADALHYAHTHGVVHRDVKPGNILIDRDEHPYVADFGLALRDDDDDRHLRYAGTPAYMSPEQARGEGHRVDGRSDIFSLGVVFYELLVGNRPFHADSRAALLEDIVTTEPRPPRQVNDTIPRELERICLKALAKRATERYSTAKDMADDLRHFSSTLRAAASSSPMTEVPTDESRRSRAGALPDSENGGTAIASGSDSRPIRVVPKGLRSFDEHDADFFLELLPGPRDRDGLPESIRFWKHRIEETDPDATFCVGLLYGPSGCGKSSFVRAGLLPRLADDVTSVYVESSAEGTEARLLNGLGRRCAGLQPDRGLRSAVGAIRRGEVTLHGTKLLIVLDQFEQWLQANAGRENTDLAQALRQCDGTRVQCLVLIRDDFWLAASRFMREIEVEIRQGENSGLVDLFDVDHAHKVLAAFGRAFGKLPAQEEELSADQQAFLRQAVEGLATDSNVVCVRLAIFAEMVKKKAWSTETLRALGGMDGVGEAFLEETFCARNAPPGNRVHERAARQVLEALLPVAGDNIRGKVKSRRELLAASGYDTQPRDFDALLHVLDTEGRLVTRADGAAQVVTQAEAQAAPDDHECYQLSHDYLVPALRNWLTHKQRETRRGRAALLLNDYAAFWSSKPQNRYLPSMAETARIGCLTDSNRWTDTQRKMMHRSIGVRGAQAAILATVLAALVVGFAMWIRAPGILVLKVQPIGAQVNIGDKTVIAKSPRNQAKFRPGTYPVLASCPDYATERREVSVGRLEEKEFRLTLKHDQGTLEAECEPLQSLIVVDGTEYGSRIRNHLLDTGHHTLSAWAFGCFEAKPREIRLVKDIPTKVRFWLDRGLAWLYTSQAIQGTFVPVADVNHDGVPDIAIDNLGQNLILSGKDGTKLMEFPGCHSVVRALTRLELGGNIGTVICVTGVEEAKEGCFLYGYCAPIDRPQKALWEKRIRAENFELAPGTPMPGENLCCLNDLSDDGVAELCFGAVDGRLYIIDGATGQLRNTLICDDGKGPNAAILKPFENEGRPCVLSDLYSHDQDGSIRHVISSFDLGTSARIWRVQRDHIAYPCLCHVDNKGSQGVVVFGNTGWEVLDLRTGKPRWQGDSGPFTSESGPRKPGEDAAVSLYACDLDQDGVDEIIAIPHGGQSPMIAISLSTGEILWSRRSRVNFQYAAWDSRTKMGHLLIPTENALCAVDPKTGKTAWSYDKGKVDGVVRGDLDNDGQEETIIGVEKRGLVCLDDGGHVVWSLRMEADVVPVKILPDIDHDGLNEIIVYRNGALVGLVRSPRVLWQATATGPLLAQPCVLDVDDDGVKEVIQVGPWPGSQTIRCLDGRNGCERWSSDRNIAPNSAPALADWDRDGQTDIIALGPETPTQLHQLAFRAANGQIVGQPVLFLGARAYTTPSCLDLDGDGILDILVADHGFHLTAISGRGTIGARRRTTQ